MTPREGWFERDGVRLHYLEWPGETGRAIFALHGLSSNARFWSRVASHLDGRRLIALDQRSHGRSDRMRDGDGLAAFVADARHAIAELGLARPVLAGHSWGASIALELAARHPETVSALGFIDGPAWPLSDSMTWAEFAARSQSTLPRHSDLAAAIDAVEAEPFADRPIGRLSGGEQQRLLLAQALAGGPRILLLDEPLASLDVRNQVAIAHLVDRVVRERGVATLMVTHDVNPILGVIDQVVYIAQGRVVAGTPSEVVTTATLSAVYGAQVEVLRDSHGHVFVVGLDQEAAHPHEQ